MKKGKYVYKNKVSERKMLLSFAKYFPKMVDRSLLLVPSGIAHGTYLPMVSKMIIPFTTYYIHPKIFFFQLTKYLVKQKRYFKDP